jgi:hypothetical protein
MVAREETGFIARVQVLDDEGKPTGEFRTDGIGVLVLGPFSFPCNISLALISLHIRSKLLPPATHFPQEASSDLLFWIRHDVFTTVRLFSHA